MTRLAEVISTVQRRRRWTAEEKVTILDDAFRPGGSVAAAAERNEVSRALIYLWRKQVKTGGLPGVTVSGHAVGAFAPVRIAVQPAAPLEPGGRTSRERRRPAMIEIALANGRVVKSEDGIDPAWLARIVAALDGGAS